MSTPRNAPCPCGSGRKYKHCCGAEKRKRRVATGGASLADLQAQWDLTLEDVIEHADHHFDVRRQLEFEDRILRQIPEPADERQAIDFYVHFVTPQTMTLNLAKGMALERGMEHTAAARWLAAHPHATTQESEMVEFARHTPLSFFRVDSIGPRIVGLHDLLAGATFKIANHDLDWLAEGDVICAQVADCRGQHVLLARDPRPLDHDAVPALQELADRLEGDEPYTGQNRYALIAHQDEVRRAFGDLIRANTPQDQWVEWPTDYSMLVVMLAEYEFDPAARSDLIARLKAVGPLEARSPQDADHIVRYPSTADATEFVLPAEGDERGLTLLARRGAIMVDEDVAHVYAVTPSGLAATREVLVAAADDLVTHWAVARHDMRMRNVPDDVLNAQRQWTWVGSPDHPPLDVPDLQSDPPTEIMRWISDAMNEYIEDAVDYDHAAESVRQLENLIPRPEGAFEDDWYFTWMQEPFLYFHHYPPHMLPFIGYEHVVARRWLADWPDAPEPLRQIMEAGHLAHYSIYQVTALLPDGRVTLNDLLLDVVIDVELPIPERQLMLGSILLARIIEHDGRHLPVALHHQQLPAEAADAVRELADYIREEGALRGDPQAVLRLMGDPILEAFQTFLTHPSNRMPEMQNTEGHELVWMETTMAFEGHVRARIIEGLEAHEWFEADEKTGAGAMRVVPPGVDPSDVDRDHFTWSGPSSSAMFGDSVIRGGVTVGPSRLVTQTNSDERQAELLEILGQLAEGELNHVETTRERIDAERIQRAARERAQSEEADSGVIPWDQAEVPPEVMEALRE